MENNRKEPMPMGEPVGDASADEKKTQGEDELRHATVVGFRRDDGTLEITFGERDLDAKADFVPAVGEGQVLTPDYIAAVLERLNITYGVDWDGVQDAALECNLNRHPVRNILIARGDPPVEEVSEYFEMEGSFQVWPHPSGIDVPRIDYREISPFIIVKKGQILARLKPRVIGRDGRDVHGNPIPMTVRRPEGAKTGPNTRVEGDSIVATCDGRLVEKAKELSVEEVLMVKGTVGYQTGHIVFPGDVVIDGTVADGFKVYAGGNIVSKQTFDATDVVTKKDMIVAGGLIGRGRASVRVGGSLRAKFIQNCRVACRGPIVVGSTVINSQIYTLQTLDLGEKGRIVGGEAFAVHGVRAAGIGNETSRATKIHCGIDFTAQQELDRVNEKIRLIALKLTKLREFLFAEDGGGSNGPRINEAIKKMEEEMMKLRGQAGDLLGKLDVDENATVEVSEEIAKGSLIEICHIAFFVDTPLKKVRFRLNKEQGRLVHEGL